MKKDSKGWGNVGWNKTPGVPYLQTSFGYTILIHRGTFRSLLDTKAGGQSVLVEVIDEWPPRDDWHQWRP